MTSKFNLTNHIRGNELLTSSSLIGRCVAAGLDQVNARQLVRRGSARNGVWRSEKLALQNNGRLFCHSSFKDSPEFIAQLLTILAKERPGLHRMVRKLVSDEVVLEPHARMLLASPVDPRRVRYPSYGSEIAALEEIMGGRLEAKGTLGERLVMKKLSGTVNSSAAGLSAQTAFQVEIALTNILIEHFRRQNFISWNAVVGNEIRQGLISFNNYPFFAATFSWISPLARWDTAAGKSRPTPVVFHACSGTCTVWDVEGFAARIERAGDNKTSRLRIMGVLAAADFETEAWKRAKEKGFLAINLRQLFGEFAFEAILQIQELLKTVYGDPTKTKDAEYKELATKLQDLKTNPFIADLKSFALEALSGFLVRNDGWEEVQLNLKVPFQLPEGATEREVDVSGQKNSWDEVCIIECKAEAGTKALDPEYVRKFFTETVPAFLAAKCSVRNPSHCRAEIWTTGVVTDLAKKALEETKVRKFVIPALRDRKDLIGQLPRTFQSAQRLINTIAEIGNVRVPTEPATPP